MPDDRSHMETGGADRERAGAGADDPPPSPIRRLVLRGTPPPRDRLPAWLSSAEAAAFLGISPSELRSWETSFGFPQGWSGTTRRRRFASRDVVALADALSARASVAEAVGRARASLAARATAELLTAITHPDLNGCEAALAALIRVRPAEAAAEFALVPALEHVESEHGYGSPQWAFAAAFASRWLEHRAASVLAPIRPGTLLICDASHDALDADGVYVKLLAFLCRRGGLGSLVVSPLPPEVRPRTTRELAARAIVIAGAGQPAEVIARWLATRPAPPGSPVRLYRRKDPSAGTEALPPAPGAARDALLALLAS